ncbi:hypothetical protein [Saccharospirillum impatiens]|jgi:hypothetical protein|uniref:hypothetical protein n=1 Tax=Saccharospirillum impatiens TaxID=169438 RepID=UPI000415474E|nr:hypothetical protein [Saccharospirillum impatiens]
MQNAITVTVHPEVLKELAYIVELHKRHGAVNPMNNVQDLVDTVLASIADGSRRPGSWERSLLEHMGLVADGDDHHWYRPHYGPDTLREKTRKLTGGGARLQSSG